MKFIIELDGVTSGEDIAKAISFTKKSKIKLIDIQPADKDRNHFFGISVKSSTVGNYVSNIFARDCDDVPKEFARLNFPGRLLAVYEEPYSPDHPTYYRLEAADKKAAEKEAADKKAADKIAADKKAADKIAADKIAADKIAADKIAADKIAADKIAADKKAAAEK